jgi:hypothetical protein
MMIDEKNYIIYGLTSYMEDVVNNKLKNLVETRDLNILDSISNSSCLTQNEKNIVIFEIGRKYGSGKC